MRKKYRRPNPGMPVEAIRELWEMPEPDHSQLREEAEACKRRILERRQRDKEKQNENLEERGQEEND